MTPEEIADSLPPIQRKWLLRAVITYARDGMIISSRMAECMRFNLVRKGIIKGGRRSVMTMRGLTVRRILETRKASHE